MESFVTPCAVAPPLSAPAGQGATHSGANTDGNLTRLVAGSQLGFASAAGVPMPGNFGALAAGAAAVPVAALAVPATPVPLAPGEVADLAPVAAGAPGVAGPPEGAVASAPAPTVVSVTA